MTQENKRNLLEGLPGFLQGAQIGQFIMCVESGAKVVYQENAAPQKIPASAYTDEVVGRAIMALNGEKKPLCEKQLFLGIIKVLAAKCGWSSKWATSCDRINELPVAASFEVKCDYNNVKGPCALKFASLQYAEWEDYEPTPTERDVFYKNRHLAALFEEELDRQAATQQ